MSSLTGTELAAWILSKTQAMNECLIWQGAVGSGGSYGVYRGGDMIPGRGRRHVYVHRAIWEALRGPIPDGLVIDHECNTPLCCNVEHMKVTTQAENARRGQLRRWRETQKARRPDAISPSYFSDDTSLGALAPSMPTCGKVSDGP